VGDGGDQDVDSRLTQPTVDESLSLAEKAGPVQPIAGSHGEVPGSGMLTPSPAEPVPPEAVTAARPTQLVPFAVPDTRPEVIDAIVVAVLAKLTPQLDEAADARYKAYTEKIVWFTDQFVRRAEANLHDAANRTEDKMVASTEQKLGALVDRIQAWRTIIAKELAKFDALQKNAAAVVKDTDQKIREASQLAIRSAQQEVAISLRKGVERTTATLEGECQALVLDVLTRTVSATLAQAEGQLAVQTKDQLSQAYAGLKSHQERMIEGINEQLSQIVLVEKNNLSAKLETMAGEIVPLLRTQVEKSLRQSAGRVTAETTRSLQEQARLLTQGALVSVQQAAQSLEDRMHEDNQRQFTARSDRALESFRSGLQTLTGEMQEDAAKSFSQKLQCTADEMAAAAAEKARQRVHDEAVAATEIFSKESNERLSAMAEEFFARSSKEFQERLRSHAEEQLDAVMQSAPDKFNERLDRLTQAAGLTLVKVTARELQKLAATLFESSSAALRQEVAQLTDNLQNDLKASQASFSEEARKQLLAISQSTVQALNREAQTGVEKFRARLQKAAQESHEESIRELETNFQDALKELRAAIFPLLEQPKP
jgi:hypothetical protein